MSVDVNTIGVGVDTKQLAKAIVELNRLEKTTEKTLKELDKLAYGYDRQGKLITDASIRMAKAAEDNSRSVDKQSTAMSFFGKTSGFVMAAAGAAALGFANSIVNTGIQIEKLNNTLKFSTGSAGAAAKELDYLKSTTEKLGLEFTSTATAYAKFAAASKGTNLEGQKTRDIFESIAKASTVLGLSADETGGALKAIEQIISKGTVSAEELRGQLGERLPGAFQIAARAMGVTTQELGDMLKAGELVSDDFLPKFAAELNKTLGNSPESAAGSAQAQLNRLTNAWTEFKKTIAESGVITIVVSLVEGTAGALKFLTTGLSDISGNKNWQKTKLSQLLDLKEAKNFSNFSESQINTDIAKLRRSLGIAQQFDKQTRPATGSGVESLIAPNFGAVKKEGQGGYDARVNEDVEAKATRINDAQKKAQDALTKQKLGAQQLYWDTEARKYDQTIKRIVEEDKLKEKQYKEREEAAQKYFELEERKSKEAQRMRDEAAEKIKRQYEEIADFLGSRLSGAITEGIFKGGSRGARYLKELFSKLVLEPLLKPLTSGIASALQGAFGDNSILTGKGDGSIFGQLSGIGDLFKKGNSSIVSSIESLGSFLSTGTGGLGDTIGGALGQYAGAISKALPFAGAAFSLLKGDIKGAIGSGIGAALSFTPLGPVGGIIGSFVGKALGGLFGGAPLPPRFYSATETAVSGNKFTSTNPVLKYKQAGANDSLKALNEQVARSLNTILTPFGFGDSLTRVGSVVNKKKSSDGAISADLDGLFFGSSTGKIKKGTIQQAFTQLTELALGEFLVKVISGSKLSDGVKKFFNGLTKKEDVADAINTISQLHTSLKDLPPVFDAIRNAIDTTSYETSIADLKARFAAIGTYTSLFYTEQEQFDTFTKQITTQFAELNKALPKSRDEYRSLVDGITVTDESTSNLFHGLVALAPAMDAYFKQLESQKQQVDAATNSLRDLNSFTSLAEYRAYRGVANNYGTTTALDFTANSRTGAIRAGEDGRATAGGDVSLVDLLKELRDLAKQTLIQTSDGTSALQRFDRVGIPTRA